MGKRWERDGDGWTRTVGAATIRLRMDRRKRWVATIDSLRAVGIGTRRNAMAAVARFAARRRRIDAATRDAILRLRGPHGFDIESRTSVLWIGPKR